MTARDVPFRANGHAAFAQDGASVTVIRTGSLPPFISGWNFTESCASCGAFLDLAFSDDEVTVATPCEYPDGITTVITLAVPSGRLIVADSLRPAYDWKDADLTVSYNAALGQAQAAKAMAAQGCAFGYVGNTCPGLYRTGDGTYAIASLAYDWGEDDNDSGEGEIRPEGWEELAGICTDLWAYSIADYEAWKARSTRELRAYGDTIVDVTPGTYEFTLHTGERGFPFRASELTVYADVRLLPGGESA